VPSSEVLAFDTVAIQAVHRALEITCEFMNKVAKFNSLIHISGIVRMF